MEIKRVILFNNMWQAYEDTQVMVSNRQGDKAVFCRAIDVKLGDNVWEHNIVHTMRLFSEPVDGKKFHYGQAHKD